MSHFTYLKTSFQNLLYLEKALNRLNIIYKHQKDIINDSNFENSNLNLIINQSNGYDIKFDWNGQEYELVADMSFWQKPYPPETFREKVGQEYAGELISGEGQKTGFQLIHYKQNSDGSKTVILERWNNTPTNIINL